MDSSSLPWFITRAAAIAAYFILFLMIVMGEKMASGYLYRFISPPRAWLIHKYLGVSFGIAVLTHILALLADNFMSFGVWDIFIPFHAPYRPLAVALGIGGFYLVIIILISSLLDRFQHRPIWRLLHFLTYPLFVLGLFHGILAGSDSGNWFMIFLYTATGLIFFWLLFQRLRLAYSRQ